MSLAPDGLVFQRLLISAAAGSAPVSKEREIEATVLVEKGKYNIPSNTTASGRSLCFITLDVLTANFSFWQNLMN